MLGICMVVVDEEEVRLVRTICFGWPPLPIDLSCCS